ncbi:hypothetical protein GCM10008066_27880 [Oxalicibacterium faecigallinarum]|uniref:Uncharacterized protein n=1 Tax=Oxalicibacterium faecigallinarum TaxID=573741 RepID=A0A8J3ASK1_9BURK|nr:hypothetical protein GCM10008066_27880 [Oxalicibacterium faecigallinarum]
MVLRSETSGRLIVANSPTGNAAGEPDRMTRFDDAIEAKEKMEKGVSVV